ncbi:hypothetical protein R3P38DRAFT_2912562 [Favolaschia claudopus]|uniref:Uncharacterized protein n=1 Tax=Favolaschia claudopus TaxID=2862362 RepID=A0AAW0C8T8_9AGAR
MQAANSLHAQYLGRAKGHGFLASFTLLGRKGLHKTSTEGPFHAHRGCSVQGDGRGSPLKNTL